MAGFLLSIEVIRSLQLLTDNIFPSKSFCGPCSTQQACPQSREMLFPSHPTSCILWMKTQSTGRHRSKQRMLSFGWGPPILGSAWHSRVTIATWDHECCHCQVRRQLQSKRAKLVLPQFLSHRVTSKGTAESSCYFIAAHLRVTPASLPQPSAPAKRLAAHCQVGKEKAPSWTADGHPIPKKSASDRGRYSIGCS